MNHSLVIVKVVDFCDSSLVCFLAASSSGSFATQGCPTNGPFRFGKLHLEFDDTSQLQRVRFGSEKTTAVFAVLVP